MRFALLIAASLLSFAVAAKDATPTGLDPVAQSRAVKLAAELRCLVCQNQSISESNADLAVDLRRQIAEQIAAGRSDGEIIDYMVARYGDFVRYRPALKPATVLLWMGPALLALAGIAALALTLRERRRIATAPLTEEERREAETLLRSDAERT